MKITSQPVTEHALILNDAELELVYRSLLQVVVDTPKNDPEHVGRERLQAILQTIDDRD